MILEWSRVWIDCVSGVYPTKIGYCNPGVTGSYAVFYPPFESCRYPNIISKCPMSDFIKAFATNLPD
jgi:hypothetical protein